MRKCKHSLGKGEIGQWEKRLWEDRSFHQYIEQLRKEQIRRKTIILIAILLFIGLEILFSAQWSGLVIGNRTVYVAFDAELSKEVYILGERLKVIYKPEEANYSATILGPEGNLEVIDVLEYQPRKTGKYVLNLLVYYKNLNQRFDLPFEVIEVGKADAALLEKALKETPVIEEIPQEEPSIETSPGIFPVEISVQKVNETNASLRDKNATVNVTIVAVSMQNETANVSEENVPALPASQQPILQWPKPEELFGTAQLDFSINNAAQESLETEIELLDPITGEAVYSNTGKRHSKEIEKGYYTLRLKPRERGLPEITFDNLLIDKDIRKLAEMEYLGNAFGFKQAFAINPVVQFAEAKVTAIAKGNSLYKCKDWDFANKTCNGEWVFAKNIRAGEPYTFTLTMEDPAWGEPSSLTLNPASFDLTECPVGTDINDHNMGIINASDNNRTDDTEYSPNACPDPGEHMVTYMQNFTEPFNDVNFFNYTCTVEYINEAGGSDPIGTFIVSNAKGSIAVASISMPADQVAPDTLLQINVSREATLFSINDTNDIYLDIQNDDTGGPDAIFVDQLKCQIDYGLEPRWDVVRIIQNEDGSLNTTLNDGDQAVLNYRHVHNMTIRIRNNRADALGNLSSTITDRVNQSNFLVTLITDVNGSGVGDLHPDDGGDFGMVNRTILQTFQSRNHSAFIGFFTGACGNEPDDDFSIGPGGFLALRLNDDDNIDNIPIVEGKCSYLHFIFNFTEVFTDGSTEPNITGIGIDWFGAGKSNSYFYIMNLTSGDWINASSIDKLNFSYNASGRAANDLINATGVVEFYVGRQGAAVQEGTLQTNFTRVYINVSEDATVEWNTPGLFQNASMTHFDNVDEEANFSYQINPNGKGGIMNFIFRAEGGQIDAIINNTIIFNESVVPNVTQLVPVNGTIFNVSDIINVSANVTDVESDVDQVWVNITIPNDHGERRIRLYIKGTGDGFSGLGLSNYTGEPGNYILEFEANDTLGNKNATEVTNISLEKTPSTVTNSNFTDCELCSSPRNVSSNSTFMVRSQGNDTEIEINVSTTSADPDPDRDGNITFNWYRDENVRTIHNATVRFKYSGDVDSLIPIVGGLTSTAHIFWYNISTPEWQEVCTDNSAGLDEGNAAAFETFECNINSSVNTTSAPNVTMRITFNTRYSISNIIIAYLVDFAEYDLNFTEGAPPNVSYPNPVADSEVTQNDQVNISANITDNVRLSFIYLNVTFPNGTTLNFTLFNSTVSLNTTDPPNNFTLNFNDTSQTGLHNISFFANDTVDNVNNTIVTNFSVVAATVCDCLLDNNGEESSNCEVENAVCTSNTNITVLTGGNVTLINTTLQMNATADGGLGVEVRNQGILRILNGSNVTNGFHNVTYLFKVRSGGNLTATDSHLEWIGNNTAILEEQGLALYETPIEFRNNNLSNGRGMLLFANDTVIEHNRFVRTNGTPIRPVNVTGLDIKHNKDSQHSLAGDFIKIPDSLNHSLIRNNNGTIVGNNIEATSSRYLKVNLTIANNSFRVTGGGGVGPSIDVRRAENITIVGNDINFGELEPNRGNTGVRIGANFSVIDNNTIIGSPSDQNQAQDPAGLGYAIRVDGLYNNVTGNVLKGEFGIFVDPTGKNNSIWNNTIRYLESGIWIRGDDNNVTNNTIRRYGKGPRGADLNFTSTASGNTIWLNHFLSLGVNDDGVNNNFCILTEGNLYNESIGPDKIALDNTDCGLANFTDSMDGAKLNNTVQVNWSKQSSFTGAVTYNIRLSNGSIINTTTSTNFSWDTTAVTNGNYTLTIIPNVTDVSVRVNATNNQTENFEIIADPCRCLLDNGGTETETCVVENAVCTSNTNITVLTGGNVTLINTTLRMNGTFDGQVGIEVLNGGVLVIITDSNVTNGITAAAEYAFQVFPGGRFFMEDSFVSEAGWQTAVGRRGLELNGTIPLPLDNNTFTNNFYAISVYIKNVTVIRSRIEENVAEGQTGIYVINGNFLNITNNTFDLTSISAETQLQLAIHVDERSDNVTIEGNTIRVFGGGGIDISDATPSRNVTIKNNAVYINEDPNALIFPIAAVNLILENSSILGNVIHSNISAVHAMEIAADWTVVNNNTFNASNATAVETAGPRESLNFTGNRFFAYGIRGLFGLDFARTNNSWIVNNTFYTAVTAGLRLSTQAGYNNVTNNTFNFTGTTYDLIIVSTAESSAVWLNHFLRGGVNDGGINSRFCVGGEGNFYNESIGPANIALDNTDCGLANITDAMDGREFSGVIQVNWSKQSSFKEIVTYSILEDNGTVLGTTTLNNFTFNTTRLHDGSHRLRLVPNITEFSLSINATNNQTENFTVDNFPPDIRVNAWGDDTEFPYQAYNRTPELNGTILDDLGNCRMSRTNETFDNMADDINCTGGNPDPGISCVPPRDLSLGFHEYWVACNSTLENKDDQTTTQNFTIEIISNADCSLDPSFNGIDFGEMDQDESNTSEDDHPTPLLVFNNGTVLMNITLNATNLWDTQANPSNFFLYKIEDNETGSYIAAEDTNWVQMQLSGDDATTAVERLRYVNSTNDANTIEVELNITVPSGEPSGDKQTTIDIFCLLAEE